MCGQFGTHFKVFNLSALATDFVSRRWSKVTEIEKLICETASVTIISRTTYVLCESLSPPLFALPLVFS
jgi:hypothetical protein